MPYTAFARSEMQHYTSWNHYLASINTNFSRQLNRINSRHITCLMLTIQQVNIGLMRWFPPLQQQQLTPTHSDGQYVHFALQPSYGWSYGYPPHIPTAHIGCLILEICSSRVYPSPLLSWPSRVRPRRAFTDTFSTLIFLKKTINLFKSARVVDFPFIPGLKSASAI